MPPPTKEAGASVSFPRTREKDPPNRLLLGNQGTLARRSLAQCHEPPVLACTGSACFIARLSSSVENVDRRKDVEQPLGQDALDGDARPRRGASRRRRLASRQRHHRLERPDNREMR